MITAYINGSDRTSDIAIEEISLQWRRNTRSTAGVKALDGYTPAIGDVFQIYNGATPVLIGSLDDTRSYDPGTHALNFHRLLITGHEHRLDKRVQACVAYGPEFVSVNSISDVFTFVGGYNPFSNGYAVRVRTDGSLPGGVSSSTTYYVINRTSTTLQLSTSVGGSAVNMASAGSGNIWLVWMAGAIVKDVVGYWGAAEGISAGTIRDGAVVESASFEWARPSDRIDTCANISGYIWRVNGAAQLDFVPPGEFTAPFNITDSATAEEVIDGTVEVHRTREDYANTVYLRISPDAFGPVTETLTGDGSKKFFRLSGGINDFKLIKELLAVDTFGPDDIGIYGVDSGKAWYYTPNGYWIIADTTTTAPASTFDVTYRPVGYDVRTATDAGEISARASAEASSTGIYEAVLQDTSIADSDAGDAAAAAALAARKEVPVEIAYDSYTDGILPGQQQSINLTLFGVNDTFLINDVTGSATAGVMRYRVTATSTSRLGTYLDMFRSFIGGASSVSGGGAVGAGGGTGISVDYYALTLTADASLTRTVAAAGTILIVDVTQDGTGGWDLTPDADFEDVESPLDIAVTASARTTVTFYSTGSKWRKLPGGKEIKE